MKIHLPSDLEQFVTQKIESGKYDSASDVICAALWLLKDWDALRQCRLEELRREIQIGLEQLDRGEYTVYDDKSLKGLAEEIKAEGRRRLAQREKDGAA